MVETMFERSKQKGSLIDWTFWEKMFIILLLLVIADIYGYWGKGIYCLIYCFLLLKPLETVPADLIC